MSLFFSARFYIKYSVVYDSVYDSGVLNDKEAGKFFLWIFSFLLLFTFFWWVYENTDWN